MAHIRKLDSGAKRWQARWTDPSGKEKTKTFAKKSDAERHLTATENAKLTGSYIDAAAGKVTVGEVAERWFAGKINLKPTTTVRYRSALDVHVLPRWGTVPLNRVTFGDVQSWLAKLQAAEQSGASVRKIAGVLSAVLDLAVRERRLPSNPCDGADLPRANKQRKKYLTADQVEKLADAAAMLPAGRPRRATDAAFPQYRLVILVLAYCGLRWSELAALKVRTVNVTRRRIEVAEAVTEVNGATLEWGTPKNHETRSVPVPPFLMDELAAHIAGKRPDDLVFTSPDGGVLRNRNARRAFLDRAASQIGVDGLTPHELRHTAASLAVSAGANVKAVQRMLGHASATMTLDTYADLFDDDLDAVAESLDRLRTDR